MANTKKNIKLGQILIILYLLLFPLGQLLRNDFSSFPFRITLHAIDLAVLFVFVYWILENINKQKIIRGHFANFLLAATFSLVLSVFLFNSLESIFGALYLLRLAAYYSLYLVAKKLVLKDKYFRKKLFNVLFIVLFVVMLFGWVQYIFYPDLRILKNIGWDDHLFRLAGAFLDPGFTGILMVFGSLTSLAKYKTSSNKGYLVLFGLFLLTTVFTYSRASILAMVVGLLYYFLREHKKNLLKYSAVLIIIVSLLIAFLPRPSSEGVKLERLYSVESRIINLKETVFVWSKSPVFGVGYNNICLGRSLFFMIEPLLSHSCSGSDSSLLLVLATTGITGLLILVYVGIKLTKSLRKNVYSTLFMSCLAALLIHSLFVNSLFYPWVMGWMGILLGIVYSFNKK